MSPLLFNLVIDWVMRRTTEEEHTSIRWTLFCTLEDLDFADDLALLSHTHRHMQDKTDKLNKYSSQVGLKINQKKSEVMTLNTITQTPIKINNNDLPFTDRFVYLGSIITPDGGSKQDIQNRLSKARNAFISMNNIWKSSKYSVRTKLKLYNSCVLPVLLYGAECEIIEGREAWPHSRPYMAHLRIQHGKKILGCGGFLVEENFVLTAAHCWGEEINVTLGAHKIKDKERTQQKITVRQQIPHPEYDDKTLNNDIMLLKLAKPAKLNGEVGAIPLPCAGEETEAGTVCRVAGWGRTFPEDDSSAANALQEVEVDVLDNEECSYDDNYDPATMLCAGHSENDRNSAQGDSGGPLLCGGKAQGIVSWGPDTPPGVYTRVSTFIDWIHKKMRRPQP
ncbi:mast cell protease 1A-like [Pelodiscus sinensis]|uniref:mast cell protease 1A-like n=1 Tax=Pelodiscus sinensis TaxID=13735 RepID=UPI003F6AA4F1